MARHAILLAAVGAVVLVAAAWVLVDRSRTRVDWAMVMQATEAAKTVNAVARVSGEDGTEWAYSLWVRVDGPGSYSPKGMLVPVKAAKGAKPSEQTALVADAVDYCERGAALAKARSSSRGRWTRWGGRRMLEVTVLAPKDASKGPDRWRFYLDPQTRLVQGVEVFVGDTLRASAEYRYGQPLPPEPATRPASESGGEWRVGE